MTNPNEFNSRTNPQEMKVLASVGPIPKKRPINKSANKLVIQYNDQVYAITTNELINRGLDYYNEIIEMSKQRGLADPSSFSQNCLFCNYSNKTIFDLMGFQTTIIPDASKIQNECNYKSRDNVRVAKAYYDSQSKKQKPFYAIQPNCAFIDSLVSCLGNHEELEDVKSEILFEFKSTEDFEQYKANPNNFLVTKYFPKKGLVSKIFDFFKK
ncbi:MAG: hypothetical protein WC438_00495 [Candidatus Pacearchaeota archaeon]